MKNPAIVRTDLSGFAISRFGGSLALSREMWPTLWYMVGDLSDSLVEGKVIQNIDFVFSDTAFRHPSRTWGWKFQPQTIRCCRSSSNSCSSCRLMGTSSHFILVFGVGDD